MTDTYEIFGNIKKSLIERFGSVADDKDTIGLLKKANSVMTINELSDSAQTIASWPKWLYYVECRCRGGYDIQSKLIF